MRLGRLDSLGLVRARNLLWVREIINALIFLRMMSVMFGQAL